MSPSIAEANDALRTAVQQRREAQAAGKPYQEWYTNEFTQAEIDAGRHRVAEATPERHIAADMLHDATRLTDEDLQQQIEDHHLHRAGLTQDELDEAIERLRGDGIAHVQQPGSLPFLELLEELRQLHYEKTAQYGGTTDPFENVTASAKCGVEPWRRALCDLSDCVVRMQRFANGQPVDYENALIDAANWSLICLLKLREAKRA